MAGVNREFDTEITEQTPDQVIAWKSTDGGHSGRVTFEPWGTAETRVDIRLNWEPAGVVEKTEAALNFDQHQVRKQPRISRSSSRAAAAENHRFAG